MKSCKSYQELLKEFRDKLNSVTSEDYQTEKIPVPHQPNLVADNASLQSYYKGCIDFIERTLAEDPNAKTENQIFVEKVCKEIQPVNNGFTWLDLFHTNRNLLEFVRELIAKEHPGVHSDFSMHPSDNGWELDPIEVNWILCIKDIIAWEDGYSTYMVQAFHNNRFRLVVVNDDGDGRTLYFDELGTKEKVLKEMDDYFS